MMSAIYLGFGHVSAGWLLQ